MGARRGEHVVNDVPLNPVEIERKIRDVSDRMAKGVSVCDQLYRALLATDHRPAVAYAQAYLNHNGPAHEKKYGAELATQAERLARDEADAAHRYADRTARALENELRALQSVGASIRAMYGVAGRGDGS